MKKSILSIKNVAVLIILVPLVVGSMGAAMNVTMSEKNSWIRGAQASRSTWVAPATVKIFKDATGNSVLSTVPMSSTTTHLSIARNGVDFFQVVVTAGDNPLTGVSVSTSALTDGKGNSIASSQVKAFLEYYVNVRSETFYESVLNYQLGFYPDALIPLGAPFDVSANSNQPLWIEVSIPSEAQPGNYTGTMSFSGGLSEEITFTVEVLDFAVPSHTDLFNPGYADFWELNNDGSLTDQEYLNLIQAYTEFFTKRDINLARTYDPVDVPVQDASGTWDFETWLEGMLPLLNGGVLDAFSPPILRVPVELEILGHDASTASSSQAQNDYKDFLRQFHSYITTQSLVDLSSAQWIVWIGEFDEPNSAELTDLISLYYNLTQEINAELSPFTYYYQIDGTIDWDSAAIQHSFNQDISGWTRLGSSFDYWMAPQEDFEFDLGFIQDRSANGQKVMIYQQVWTALPQGDEEIPLGFPDRDYEFPSLPGIVNPALFHRILPWFAWKYDAVGIGFWAVMFWYDDVNGTLLDMWVDDPAIWLNFRTIEQAQNGDGWLVYPGNKVNEHSGQPDVNGPVSSLRLELFRKGLEDYKYLKLLETNMNSFDSASKTQARSLLDSVENLLGTITSFDRDPQRYDDLLYNIKQLLSGKSISTDIGSTGPTDGNDDTDGRAEATPWGMEVTTVVLIVLGIVTLNRRKYSR